MGYLGAFDEGKAFLEKGLSNASEMNDLIALGFVEMQYGYFCLAKGDWEPSKEHFEKGIKHSEEAKIASCIRPVLERPGICVRYAWRS